VSLFSFGSCELGSCRQEKEEVAGRSLEHVPRGRLRWWPCRFEACPLASSVGEPQGEEELCPTTRSKPNGARLIV
jgi:hypothetical protein